MELLILFIACVWALLTMGCGTEKLVTKYDEKKRIDTEGAIYVGTSLLVLITTCYYLMEGLLA